MGSLCVEVDKRIQGLTRPCNWSAARLADLLAFCCGMGINLMLSTSREVDSKLI